MCQNGCNSVNINKLGINQYNAKSFVDQEKSLIFAAEFYGSSAAFLTKAQKLSTGSHCGMKHIRYMTAGCKWVLNT